MRKNGLHFQIPLNSTVDREMPFTPVHMGPGLLVKAVLQGSFSLMVFGWAQVVMDIQPLVVILTGEGHLHGFSHTYLGATLLGMAAAATGKYLSELGLGILGIPGYEQVNIGWRIVFLSAFIGTYSHVAIDSIMHGDMAPYYPISAKNHLLGVTTVEMLHKLCFYSGVLGAVLYFAVSKFINISIRRKRTHESCAFLNRSDEALVATAPTMSSQFMLLVGGVFNITFFVFHAFFWRLFDWN